MRERALRLEFIIFAGLCLLALFAPLAIALPSSSKEASLYKENALDYRRLGYAAQLKGDLQLALVYYQKALQLDPFDPGAYNDLGIVLEAMGRMEEAKELYYRAMEIDPYHMATYSNLAALFEAEGDYEQAAYFWLERIRRGEPGELWTQKAKERLKEISVLIPNLDPKALEKVLAPEYASQLQPGGDIKSQARYYLQVAKGDNSQGRHLEAVQYLAQATFLDPENKEIRTLLEEVETRLLTE